MQIRLSDLSIELSERLQKPEMTEVMARQLEHWISRLEDAPTLELPADRPRPAVQSFRRETQKFSLSSGLIEGLKALSRREGVTLIMFLMSAFQILLHRYSGQDDIVIGVQATERNPLEYEGLNCFLGNPLVLRTDLSGNPSFRELLAQVREVVLGACVNQDIPFEKLMGAFNLQADGSRNPLFQIMFILQNLPDDNAPLNKTTSDFLQADTGAAQFDFALELSETPHGLTGEVKYATDLFEASTIGRLIGHFQILLCGIVADPGAHLSEFPLLTEPERRQLLVSNCINTRLYYTYSNLVEIGVDHVTKSAIS